MTYLAWAFVLLAASACVVALEMFVPSGGLLGVVAFGLLVAAIVMAFAYEPWIGFTFVVATVVAVPFLAALFVQWWPRTRLGKRILLEAPDRDDVLPQAPDRETLIGKTGTVKTLMLPSGKVQIEGMLVDALSEGIPLEPGQTVKVMAVRGHNLIVRPAEGAAQRTVTSNDALAQPLESLGIDTDEDPLG